MRKLKTFLADCKKASCYRTIHLHTELVLVLALGSFLMAPPCSAQNDLPSETPATFTPVTTSFDYVKRDVMIPMRDGVKLHTVIVIPKGAKNAPILLTRTPYSASAQTESCRQRSHLGPILNGYDNATDVIVEGGYIRVVQDVRGKYGSEGDYVMNASAARSAESNAGRPLHRHLRHHRLAGEKYSGEQRQGGHSRHFLRRIYHR